MSDPQVSDPPVSDPSGGDSPSTGREAEPEADPAAGLSTGDSEVDAAVDRLSELDDRDLDEQLEVYEDVDQSLRSVLDGDREAPGQ